MRFDIPAIDPNRRPSPRPASSSGSSPEADGDDYPPTRAPGPSTPPASLLFAGRYRIIEELGRGGMGVVSRARDTRLPRDVAIKVPIHLRDPDSLRRFFKEAEAAAKLDHPNICRILDLGEADGLPYIVLAFVDGPTLARLVGRQPVEQVRASKITRSVARTIQFAHERGIVHRDLKPANLMIGPRRELIVMDFGLARLEGDERKTWTGQVFGTPPYMSPEQVQGLAVDMGKSCDIYTLGVIFYELLTGHLPFRGAAWELPQQIVKVEPPRPSQVRAGIDPRLDSIVLKAMAKKIPDRFASMEEFASAIAEYLRRDGNLSDSGMKAAPDPTAPPPKPAARATPSLDVRLREGSLREPDRRRLKLWDVAVWASIAVLALAGLDVFLAADRRPSGDARPAGRPSPTRPVPVGAGSLESVEADEVASPRARAARGRALRP